jgi:CubicO group peptidase (beta-lactamase class C family)
MVAAFLPLLVACSSAMEPEDPADIASWMELYDVPGASIAVINDFAIDYVEVHGVKSESSGEPVTESTLFQAASMSKTVSAVAVMSLVQDGVVSLDVAINDYLTSWTLPDNALQDRENVTLRRLLSHTAGTTVSGFRGYRYTEPLPTLVQILDGEPPANSPPVRVTFVPGSDWRYSGGGYEVMEQAIRDVTGTTYPDFVRERVLEPVGMASSTYEQPIPPSLRASAASGYYADGTPVPGGHHIYPEMAAAALWTTSADVARFLIELQLSLRGESNRVLSRESTELLLTEVRNHYALGINLWTLHGQPYIGHSAANDGFRGRMVAHMTQGNGVIVLTNSDNGNLLADAVIELIGKREGWTGF